MFEINCYMDFADLSFGGSSYRSNNLERWNYYFCNLDIYRKPVNSKIQAPFDPIDNNLEVMQELILIQ
ncbi:hypothetical protein [Xylocopilactobacillus apicola]|uniref:hypothetical protein n=1 Tax=Xylocopilactobacillus apicola TaxID=2932184 RepID=UPI003CE53115